MFLLIFTPQEMFVFLSAVVAPYTRNNKYDLCTVSYKLLRYLHTDSRIWNFATRGHYFKKMKLKGVDR